MLICVIYIIVDNFVCIYYLACQSKQICEISKDRKYLVKYFNEFLGIGIPYFFNKLIVLAWSHEEHIILFILKFPRRMLEYYFSKGFGILEQNSNHLKKIPNLEKQKIHAEETHDPDYVITFNITITSIENNLNRLLLQSSLNYSCVQNKYNGK